MGYGGGDKKGLQFFEGVHVEQNGIRRIGIAHGSSVPSVNTGDNVKGFSETSE